MELFRKKQHSRQFLGDDRGQSTVEYLIVTFMVVAALVYPTSIFDTIGGTLKNKYQSYCFGVSISDPPRKDFDDKLAKGAEMAEMVIETIKDVEGAASAVENFRLPDSKSLPSIRDISIGDIVEKELPFSSH